MNWLNITMVSLSMAIDASSVNATNGIVERNIKKRKLLLIGLVFGVFQGMMPLIGYFIGLSFKEQIEKYIPWVAFSLLTLLGIKAFFEWLKDFKKIKEDEKCIEKEECLINKISISKIFIQAIATSIDALCIGFVYLNEPINNALIIFLIIGITTFIMSALAGILAKQIGSKLEKWASLIASIVFIAIGIKILLEGIL